MRTCSWSSSWLWQKKTTDRASLLYCHSFCCFFCLPVCVRRTWARLCQYLSSGIFRSTSEQVPSFISGRWLCSEWLVCGLMSCCRVFHQNRHRSVLVFSTTVCVGGTNKRANYVHENCSVSGLMDQSLSASPPIIPLSCPQKYFNSTEIYISPQLHHQLQVRVTENTSVS